MDASKFLSGVKIRMRGEDKPFTVTRVVDRPYALKDRRLVLLDRPPTDEEEWPVQLTGWIRPLSSSPLGFYDDSWAAYWAEPWGEAEEEEAADDQQHHADAGKPQYSLIPSRALEAMLAPLAVGARKYGARSYQQVENGPERYFESLLRHMMALLEAYQQSGAPGLLVKDPEGFLHLGAVMADAAILVDLLPHAEAKLKTMAMSVMDRLGLYEDVED